MTALAGAIALLGSVLASSPATGADPAPTSARGEIVNRGHVNATRAAAAAAGVTRLPTRHTRLGIDVRTAPHAGIAPTREGQAPAPRIILPSVIVPIAWQGIGQTNDGLALEPPDPWIAVNSSFVVQSVNSRVRIYDRNGSELLTIPTWALFGLGEDEFDADPRILWDPQHGRWVGVLLSWTQDGLANVTSGFLNLAVSDGADPRGSWQVFGYSFDDGANATLPDYPAIASSSDKIVLTANEFDNTQTSYVGGSLLVVRWSDILAGTDAIAQWTLADPNLWTIRPAQLQSPGSVVHLVAEDATTGNVLYARLGSPTVAISSWTDLTANPPNIGRPNFFLTTPPRQPGSPATIADAVDERITDAVWRANKLAFVTTAGFSGDDFVRVTILDTATAVPTKVSDELLGPGGGIDTYMGGIGFTGNGVLCLVYTQSSSSAFTSTRAAFVEPGSAWTPSILVDSGTGTYAGSRWGDYVGVALDPSGADTVWVADQVARGDGSWDTTVQRLSVDTTMPVIAAPAQALVPGTTLGSFAIPVKVSWAGTDPGSGVQVYDIELDQWGTGSFSAGRTNASSLTRLHWWKSAGAAPNRSYRYSVTGIDASQNASGAVTGPAVTPTLYQQTSATFSGTWSTATGAAYSGGSVRWSSKAGASASFRTSGRSFAFVTSKASTRGKARIYVDGVLKSTLNLKSSATKNRNLVYVVNFSSSGTHTVKVVVVSGRVDVDAFLVLK